MNEWGEIMSRVIMTLLGICWTMMNTRRTAKRREIENYKEKETSLAISNIGNKHDKVQKKLTILNNNIYIKLLFCIFINWSRLQQLNTGRKKHKKTPENLLLYFLFLFNLKRNYYFYIFLQVGSKYEST